MLSLIAPPFSNKIMSKKSTPSEDFLKALHTGTSPVADCEFCNRTYFSEDPGAFEGGELEGLRQKSTAEPDKYIEQDSGIFWGRLDGRQAVIGCSCDAIPRYETYFWRSRNLISRYFENRAENLRRQATIETQRAESVAESVRTIPS